MRLASFACVIDTLEEVCFGLHASKIMSCCSFWLDSHMIKYNTISAFLDHATPVFHITKGLNNIEGRDLSNQLFQLSLLVQVIVPLD